MFIRETITKNKKTNTSYKKHVLVESFRTENGPRQRTLMQLGCLDLPKSQWKKLADALESRLSGQTSLFEQEPEISKIVDDAMSHYSYLQIKASATQKKSDEANYVSVDLNTVTTAESRSLGPELVAHQMWLRLGFDEILSDCGFSPDQLALAEAAVVGRLVEPCSDLASWRWLTERTSLLEMLPVDLSRISKNPVYEIADALFLNKDRIEKELCEREANLFTRPSRVFLYDLTNTYFEGTASNNSLAKRGKSKEKRTDCPLVTLALVVDEDGFPVFSQIYSGNQSEPATLEDVLERLTEDAGLVVVFDDKPMLVMDRGIATKDNLNLIREKGFPYIVIERRATEKDYIDDFTNARETFEKLLPDGKSEDNIFIKKVPCENGNRVLCLSEGREKKEMAMDTLKEERLLDDLSRLKKSVEKGSFKLAHTVGERVGKLKQKYPSIARYYNIEIILDEENKNALSVRYEKKESRKTRNTLTGCYVIETSNTKLSASEVWNLYMTLTRVESAFKALKTDLGVRPVYHQTAERTKAHLFISMLAYHMHVCIEYQLRQQDDHRSWSTIKSQLSTHQRSTVILTDDKDQIHHVRVSGMPESVHNEIYRLLDVTFKLPRKSEILKKRL